MDVNQVVLEDEPDQKVKVEFDQDEEDLCFYISEMLHNPPNETRGKRYHLIKQIAHSSFPATMNTFVNSPGVFSMQEI